MLNLMGRFGSNGRWSQGNKKIKKRKENQFGC